MGESAEWIDQVMAVVADVDWHDLEHAYGTAEHTPLALRTWLSGDDRPFTDIDEDDELWPVIADYESQTVADSALAWIYVSVFHQGSLYSASAPTCRVMNAVLELSPIGSLRTEALRVIAYVLRIYDHEPYYDEWQADGFHRLTFRHIATYDAIDAGWMQYVRTIALDKPHETRALAAHILSWMSNREACAAAVIDVLSEEDDTETGGLEAELRNRTTGILVRSLGLLARGTALEEIAERGVRSFLAAEGDLGLTACVALARLRRVEKDDTHVVERIELALEDDALQPGAADMYLDALLNIALHSAPRWDPDGDPAHVARYFSNRRLKSMLEPSLEPSDPVDQHHDEGYVQGRSSRLERHHRLDTDAPVTGEPVCTLVNERRNWAAHSAVVDDSHFVIGCGPGIHVISLATLKAERTLTMATETEIERCVIAHIDSPAREGMGEHWSEPDPTTMQPGELATSPDGRWLGAYGTGLVAIWDLHEPQSFPVAYLTGFTPTRVEFAWSPDSGQLVTKETNELHFWDVDNWSSPTTVVAAVGAKRLAWPGKYPLLFQHDRIYRWNPDHQSAERIELPDGRYPVGLALNEHIFISDQPTDAPVSSAVQWDTHHWAQLENEFSKTALTIQSPAGRRRYELTDTSSWAQSIWWWSERRLLVHQNGNTAIFRRGDGTEVASCSLVDIATGDLVWTAPPGRELAFSTDREELVAFFIAREFDRAKYIDDPAQRASLCAAHNNAQPFIDWLKG